MFFVTNTKIVVFSTIVIISNISFNNLFFDKLPYNNMIIVFFVSIIFHINIFTFSILNFNNIVLIEFFTENNVFCVELIFNIFKNIVEIYFIIFINFFLLFKTVKLFLLF